MFRLLDFCPPTFGPISRLFRNENNEASPMTRPIYYNTKQVAEIFDRDPHTIRDWILKGCPTPNGKVRLEAAKLGKSWTIKDEWLAVFELRVRPQRRGPDLDLE